MQKPIQTEQQKKKKETRRIILFILLFCLLLAGAMVGVAIYYKSTTPAAAPSSSSGPALDTTVSGSSSHASSVAQVKTVKIQDNLIRLITFSSGSAGSQGTWMLENKKANTVIMQAKVFIGGKTVKQPVVSKTGKTTYQDVYVGKNLVQVAETVPVKPGQKITGITLQRDVLPGNYDAEAVIYNFDETTQQYTYSFGYPLILKVG